MMELVVFDMAGTTVHDGDAVNACFRAALAAADLRADPDSVNAVMGLPKPEAIRLLLAEARPGVQPDAAEVDSLHGNFVCRMQDYYANDPAVREIPGASATFTTLRRAGIKVALNTGFSRSIADVLLARLGWQSPAVIDADVASDEVPRGRPHPDMIRRLMESLDIHDVRQVAKVGDTRADLEEGANAGCGLVIGVTTGSFTAAQLRNYPHTHIVASVADIPRLILP